MKKILLFLILINFACAEKTIEPDTAYVSGQTGENFKDKELYLQYILEDSLRTDTTRVDSDGKFEFEIAGVEHPVLALLTNDLENHAPKVSPSSQFHGLFTFQFGSPSLPVQYGEEKDAKMFALEEGQVTIEINDSIYNSVVLGKSFNEQLKSFHKELNGVVSKYNQFEEDNGDFTKVKDVEKMDSLAQLYSEIWQERIITYRDHIMNNPDSLSSLFALYYFRGGINMDVVRYYDMLGPSVKNSAFGEPIKAAISNYKENSKRSPNVNDTMQNFLLRDRYGEEIALYDTRSKFIFVDFWASWCGPCRVENRAISEFYGNYKPEDFQMIGISVDEKEEEWIGAMEKDKVSWVSLHDKNKAINDNTGITGLPTNFLLDQNFKVVEKQLDSEELREKLDEHL